MTTTQQMIETYNRLKVYEKLEIKRRISGNYESSWVDVSTYLMLENAPVITQRLDFESYGYGEFKTGSASFMVDNTQGAWNPPGDNYSLFQAAQTRQYTRIKYSAGYKDENGDNIDEVAFEGLLNQKTLEYDYSNGTVTFSALPYQQIFSERTMEKDTLTASMTISDIVAVIMSDNTVLDYITYSAGDINPDTDITFDDATQFETKKYAEILDAVCKISNSVWYVDSSFTLIIKARAATATTTFPFVGGYTQDRAANIIDIEFFDDGWGKAITEIIYDDGENNYQRRANPAIIEAYGLNTINLEGKELTTESIINTQLDAIIDEWQTNRKRLIITTVYMPNVIGFFDRCTVDYRQKKKQLLNKNSLIFNNVDNNKTYWNDGYYYAAYKNRLFLLPDTYYLYYGFEHDIKEGITRHYLIQA